jgi:hypothetical protein
MVYAIVENEGVAGQRCILTSARGFTLTLVARVS